ncbi:MAG: hypothetical protein SVY10_10810 [Thermodesulfobacteriota bacterium]|nr:hypothetical protein [Thermodesulfobacteriota bacterium]
MQVSEQEMKSVIEELGMTYNGVIKGLTREVVCFTYKGLGNSTLGVERTHFSREAALRKIREYEEKMGA